MNASKRKIFDTYPQKQIYSTPHSDDKQLYILITSLFGRFSSICILFFSMNKLQAPGAVCRNMPAIPWTEREEFRRRITSELQASGTFCKHCNSNSLVGDCIVQ